MGFVNANKPTELASSCASYLVLVRDKDARTS